jgi:hypothetical protein
MLWTTYSTEAHIAKLKSASLRASVPSLLSGASAGKHASVGRGYSHARPIRTPLITECYHAGKFVRRNGTHRKGNG